MKEKIEQRLNELKKEFEQGQTMLNDLDQKRENLRETLLRISGAIQILEEQVSSENKSDEPLNVENSEKPVGKNGKEGKVNNAKQATV